MSQSAAQKAMWLRIRAAGGLRKLIRENKRKFGPASNFRKLYHISPRVNRESILVKGLQPGAGKGYFSYYRAPEEALRTRTKATWLGSRRYVQKIMAPDLKFTRTDLYKVKVPKRSIESMYYLPFKSRPWAVETVVYRRIKPSHIRLVDKRRVWKKK